MANLIAITYPDLGHGQKRWGFWTRASIDQVDVLDACWMTRWQSSRPSARHPVASKAALGGGVGCWLELCLRSHRRTWPRA